ncbi:unnamed protein product, partial [Sphacelaria rigidula]
WAAVRYALRTACGGGIAAQLIQELLLCCKGGGTGGGGENHGRGRGGGVGLGAARAAAACLNALSDFLPDRDTWTRFLPGTFSGIFLAVRGVGRNSATSTNAPPLPGSMALPPLNAVAAAYGRAANGYVGSRSGGSGGASDSALAESCLATLAKVLLICAGAVETAPSSNGTHAEARPPDQAEETAVGPKLLPGTTATGGGVSGTSRDSIKDASNDDGNPLAVLKRLARTANSVAGGAESSSPLGSAADASPSNAKNTMSARATTTAGTTSTTTCGGGTRERETSDRLRLLLPELLAFCRLHPGWRVRRAAATFTSSLLGAINGAEFWGSDGESSRGATNGGLLEPLMPVLMETMVGLTLDNMPQATAREGLDSFRTSLSPLRWLALRGWLSHRLCVIAEGLPSLAKSADEKRLQGAFDLLAGYVSLLGFDARAALDARLSTVLSCLCEALDFDEDFNVQARVLEGSRDGRTPLGQAGVAGGGDGGSTTLPREAPPKYFRQVMANVRADSTLASARRAIRLLGKFCDIPSLADAALSPLEDPYPRSRRTRRRPSTTRWGPEGGVLMIMHAVVIRPLASHPYKAGDRRGGVLISDERLYRRRCLGWLRPRLPMVWVLNQAFLGRLPSQTTTVPTVKLVDGGDSVSQSVGRGFAMAYLDRLLGSQAFSLPVSRLDAIANGYISGGLGEQDYGAQTGTDLTVAGRPGAIEYTRSGEILGAASASRIRGVSGQVLDANATMVGLVIEAVASLAEACDPGFEEIFLRKALYPLLEKAASAHSVVAQAAMASLSRIRSACGGFKSIPELLA